MTRTAKTPRRQGLPLHGLGVFASSRLLLVVLAASLAWAADGDSEVEIPEAKAALATLEKKLEAKAWPDALALARDLVEKHGGDLLATGERSFAPAASVAREKLAGLPEEGRAVFARLFEAEAKKALDEARTATGPVSLAAAGDRYFPLDQGAEALLLGGDRWLERGNVPFAIDAWTAVALRHPSKERRAQGLRRLHAALPLLGCRSTRDAIAAELEPEEARDFRSKGHEPRTASFEDFAVDSSGAIGPIVSFVRPRAPGHVFGLHDDLKAELDWRNAASRAQRVPMLASAHLAFDALLVLHLGRALVAVDPATGRTAWRHNDRIMGRYFSGLARARVASRWGIAREGGRIYATLETDALEPEIPRGKLVALDARTGKLVWDALADEWTEKPREQEREGRLSFVGTPLPCGGRVLCGATDATLPGETWVTACDAESGRLLWKRRLAVSTPVVMAGGRGRLRIRNNAVDEALQRLPAPYLGLAKGTLLVASNNGVTAALDPTDGHFLWAHAYTSRNDWHEGNDFARTPNPIVEAGGLVVFMPADCEHLLVVRLSDGKELAHETRLGLRTILGASGGRLLLSGEQQIAAYELDGPGLKRAWSIEVGIDREAGRGILERDVLLVPEFSGIREIDITGDVTESRTIPWGDDGVMGDLVGVGTKIASVGVLKAALRD